MRNDKPDEITRASAAASVEVVQASGSAPCANSSPCDSGHEGAHGGSLAVEHHDCVAGVDAFLSMLGRELRNPMTPLLGKVQLLRHNVHKGFADPEKIEQSLGQIEWLLLRYIARATTLLDISRLDTGTFKLQPRRTDICELIRHVAASLATMACQSGSTLECVLPASAVEGEWDTLALEQILDNLLTNAIKYGESRPIEITLGLEGGDVVIEVVDRGSGIATEEQSLIFDGFERGSDVGGAGTGLGVGLWLVRRLVTAMGGSIRVSSVPRQGSVFILIVPRNFRECQI